MQSIANLSEFAGRLRHLIRDPGSQAIWTDEVFGELALKLFELQRNFNEPYRRLAQANRKLGILKPQNWKDIPAVPTSAFKDLALSCLPAKQRTTVFHSSGTTEHRPSRHFHCAESLSVYEDSLLTWFASHFQIQNRIPIISLTPQKEAAPHSSLVHMFDSIRREFGDIHSAFLGLIAEDGGWMLNLEAATEALRQAAERDNPILILGTAFLYVHLLDHLTALGLFFKLPPGSCLMETGGYKGRSRSIPKDQLHHLICKRFGIAPTEIISEYGMSELSSQAYSRLPSRSTLDTRFSANHFRFPPWTRAQLISPETGLEVSEGETGLIRIFDLANVFSVMAIQTEDLAICRGTRVELVGRASFVEPRGCSLAAV